MPSVAPVVSNLVKLGPNHIQVHVENTMELAVATRKVTMSGGIKNVLRLKEMQDGRTPKKETVSGDVAKKTAQTMVGHLNVMELVEEVHGQNQ